MKNNNFFSIKTPLIPYFSYSNKAKANIYLKAENLQPLGSFKIRGVEKWFESQEKKSLQYGVAAASAGNMGQSIAYFASIQHIPCKIFIPDTAPKIKKEKIQSFGASIVELPMDKLWSLITNYKPFIDDMPFIHPFHSKELLNGYSAIAYEIIDDLNVVDAVIIPIGIGGLAMALSRTLKKIKPTLDIFLCEPETAAPFEASLISGRASSFSYKPSFVDAIGTPETLTEVYENLAPFIHDSLVLNLDEIQFALKQLYAQKLVCEGAAGCALAAALKLSQTSNYRNIVCILTGGNI